MSGYLTRRRQAGFRFTAERRGMSSASNDGTFSEAAIFISDAPAITSEGSQ
jgi:hypothetical protein